MSGGVGRIRHDARERGRENRRPGGTVELHLNEGPDGDRAAGHGIGVHQVVIDAVVQRAPGDTGPLTIAIEVNSCSGNLCLAPGTVRLTLP